MNKFKKIATLTLLSIACITSLTGCSDPGSGSEDKEAYISYQKMKEQNKETYPLLYFENVANTFGSNSISYYALGYKDNGKVIKKTLSDNHESYKEIVDLNVDTPYVVIDGDSYYIHRPPYYNFNQERVVGEVSAKE